MIDFFSQSTHTVYFVSCVSKTHSVCPSRMVQPISTSADDKRQQKLSSVDHWRTEVSRRHFTENSNINRVYLGPIGFCHFYVNRDMKPEKIFPKVGSFPRRLPYYATRLLHNQLLSNHK